MSDQRGLMRKFIVTRADGSSEPGGKHEDCVYFVLDLNHDRHAMPALAAYCADAEAERPALVADLRDTYKLPAWPYDRRSRAMRETLDCIDRAQKMGFTPAEILHSEAVRDGIRTSLEAIEPDSYQQRVQPWLIACFGETIAGDREERNHRFLEEALELVQSCGCTASEAHQLVDYVFGRPVGEPHQESGGVSVTHAALCLANGIDMDAAAEAELSRVWTKVEAIRAKQAAKPKHSPLPVAPAESAVPSYWHGYAPHFSREVAIARQKESDAGDALFEAMKLAYPKNAAVIVHHHRGTITGTVDGYNPRGVSIRVRNDRSGKVRDWWAAQVELAPIATPSGPQ